MPKTPPPGASPRTSLAEEAPIVSGPSLLGLNEPPSTRRRGNVSMDPQNAPSSRNLNYLLEDEEEHKRGGAGKFILVLLALVLAVGLGYLQWKKGGFDWLNSGPQKPPAATEAADGTDTTTPTPAPGAATATSPASSPSAAPPASQPSGTGSQPATDSAAAPPAGASSSPASTALAGSTAPAANPAPGGAAPAAPAADAATAKPDATAPAAAPPPATKDSGRDAADTLAPAAKPQPPPRPTPARSKPSPSLRAARAADPVAEAQKYIYGKGVRQDCDRGLRLLKPLADQANPKAMIEMGALYSAGLCTARDLPTSYRWFALALRKDPDNQSVQTDLKKLWGEMTQAERQLAIRLSQ